MNILFTFKRLQIWKFDIEVLYYHYYSSLHIHLNYNIGNLQFMMEVIVLLGKSECKVATEEEEKVVISYNLTISSSIVSC
jgi:hypothetical protein